MNLESLEESIKINHYINVQRIAHHISETEDWTSSLKDVVKLLHSIQANQRMIELTLQYWDDLFDVTIVVLKIIRDYIVPRNLICYLLKELDFIDDLPFLLERCFDLKRNGNYDIIARNLLSYFSEPGCLGSIEIKENILSLAEAQFLLENAKEYQDQKKVNCEDVIRFFNNYIGSISYADIPPWVNLLDGENLSLLQTISPGLPFEEREVISEKYVTKAKDLFHSITKEGKVKGKPIKVNMQKAFESFLSVISEQKSQTIHNPNRVFGPLNAFKERNCISSPEKEGPCRMLECKCRNRDGDEWFFNRCDECSISIRDRSHAVRIPTKEGGWIGCFCSFKCLENGIEFRDDDINLRLEAMKYTLVVDGIMNRAML